MNAIYNNQLKQIFKRFFLEKVINGFRPYYIKIAINAHFVVYVHICIIKTLVLSNIVMRMNC